MNGQQQKYLSRITQASHHLLGIINDILDFSKVEAGKLTIEQVPVDLDRVLENVSTLVAEKAASKGLELIFDVEPDVPRALVGDPLRLGQVLINFTNNAVKFTEQGEITVKVRKEDALPGSVMLHFAVQDTGIGLNDEQMSRLFNSFEQADMSTTRKFGGTGLGLAISKRLAELMGGQVGVSSQLGAGSEFWFTARLGLRASVSGDALVPHPDLRGLRLLVVDDNPSARAVLEGLLERMSFEVTSVGSGASALEEITLAEQRGRPYSVVFLDWQMPEMNGGETARRLAQLPLRQKPHCILLTGYGREEVLRDAQGCGFDEILLKPVNQSILFDGLMGVLSRSPAPVNVRPQSSVVAAPRLAGLTGRRVLLAEDNDINQEVARGLLEAGGLVVDVADNGLIAVEAARQQVYDLILMDMQMPVMDGVTAAMEIRQIPGYKKVPIVPMTANVMPEHREACEQAGMVGFIPKPIDAQVLWSTLIQWLVHPDASESATLTGFAPAQEMPSNLKSPLPEALRHLAGLNVEAGLSRTMGNADLYVSLLKRFLRTVDDLMQKTQDSLEADDRRSAQLHVHTLKGVAANIGAQEIAQASALLEQTLSGEATDPALQPRLLDLRAAVARIQAGFNTIPAQELNPSQTHLSESAQAASGMASFMPQAEKLARMLRDDDPRAVQLARENEASLKVLFGRQGQEILTLCEDMELEAAASKLEQLLAVHAPNFELGDRQND